jgi:hypothetical protein
MSGRHVDRRGRIRSAREKGSQEKNGVNSNVVVDVTESPINRPRKDQKLTIQEKKRHTLKRQVIIDVQEAKGSEQDFKVNKETIGERYL